jgi:hypothetical protein
MYADRGRLGAFGSFLAFAGAAAFFDALGFASLAIV